MIDRMPAVASELARDENCRWVDLEKSRPSVAGIRQRDLSDFASQFLASYDPTDVREDWFGKLKYVASEHGFAMRPKDFKRNPDAYKGSVAHAAQVLRVLLTGNRTSLDLFSLMNVMGPDRLRCRLTVGQSK